jgi:hypothetical protein
LGIFQRHGGGYCESGYCEAPTQLNDSDFNGDPSDDVPDPFLDDPVPTAPTRSTSNFGGVRR